MKDIEYKFAFADVMKKYITFNTEKGEVSKLALYKHGSKLVFNIKMESIKREGKTFYRVKINGKLLKAVLGQYEYIITSDTALELLIQ